MQTKEKLSAAGFSELTKENIKNYVYCLVDPRDNKIFYVGRGKGNRVFDHAKAAVSELIVNAKLNLIREIINSKECEGVQYYILRHGLKEKEAIEVEAVLINILTSPLLAHAAKMTVINQGWHTAEQGMKSIDELEAQYAALPIELQDGDYPLFVNLHRSFSKENDFDIYSAARSAWPVSRANIEKITHVLAVYHNIVRAVFIPEKWNKTTDGKRWEFSGIQINNSPYLNKNVKGTATFNPKGIAYAKKKE